MLAAAAAVAAAVAAGCGSQGRVTLSGRTTPAPIATSPSPTAVAGSTVAPVVSSHPGSTTTVRPGGTTAITRPGDSPIQLTDADSGRTVAVRVGASVELTLDGADTQWSGVTVSPDGLLGAVPAPSPPPHGVLVIWTAARSGSVRITATGTAWCPPAPQPVACPMWARPFDVTLTIS